MASGLLSRFKRRTRRPKGKPFGAIEVKTVTSEPWKELTKTQMHVYNTLKTFYAGNWEKFKAPFDDLKMRSGIKHGKTLDSALRMLEQKGWIEVIRYGRHGTGKGLRVRPNEYTLTGKYDYLRW